MMLDLGKYAEAVLSAYAISLVLLALLIGFTINRARRVREELDEVETRAKSQRSQ